ncbi:MAG TPA: DUF2062 domain-containing protein [Vicinamibacterales bacterium]|jgi:hypothetical protein|nr:DUF2062 domain-containing protein [Vicinamibacterales bacterium]
MQSPRIRRWLDQLLHTHDTPQRTAAAYALGVLFGFSPLLGLHTLLGIALAFALNLNRVAVLLGIYSNLPWILPAYYTLVTMLGAAILRARVPPRLLQDLTGAFRDASWADFRHLAHALKPLLWSYVLGSTIGAIILAFIAYRVALATIIAHRRHLVKLQDQHHQ